MEQVPRRAVHRRDLELLPVHLTEPLEAQDLVLAAFVRGVEVAQHRFVLQVVVLLADVDAIQRRLSNVDVTVLQHVGQLPEEEREQQGPDVRAVDVGVGEDDHLVVAHLLPVEVFAGAAADSGDERLDLLVLEQAVDAGALDVEDLPPDGQDRLVARVARPLGAAAGAVALDNEQFGLFRILRGAVCELARHRRRLEQ